MKVSRRNAVVRDDEAEVQLEFSCDRCGRAADGHNDELCEAEADLNAAEDHAEAHRYDECDCDGNVRVQFAAAFGRLHGAQGTYDVRRFGNDFQAFTAYEHAWGKARAAVGLDQTAAILGGAR